MDNHGELRIGEGMDGVGVWRVVGGSNGERLGMLN